MERKLIVVTISHSIDRRFRYQWKTNQDDESKNAKWNYSGSLDTIYQKVRESYLSGDISFVFE